MLKIQKSFFRYKNRKYCVAEGNLPVNLPGVRLSRKGVILIILNKGLDPQKKMLEAHRPITGRGLRDIRTQRAIKFS